MNTILPHAKINKFSSVKYPSNLCVSFFTSVHDHIVKKNLTGIIGLWDELMGMAAQKVEIPYMATSLWGKGGASNVFHILPKLDDICNALLDVMAAYKWKLVSVIYDHTVGKLFYQFVLLRYGKMQFINTNKGTGEDEK